MICITICVFIICLFTLCLVIYLNELKREKELRKLMLEQQNKNNNNNIETMPIMLIDTSKIKESNVELPTLNKSKKQLN